MQQTMVENSSKPRHLETSNDYYRLPVTEKQLAYARRISVGSGIALPWNVQQDRYKLSGWIDAHKGELGKNKFANYPSSKQVAFAERLARIKRSQVPQECFRDRSLMSRWIDSNR